HACSCSRVTTTEGAPAASTRGLAERQAAHLGASQPLVDEAAGRIEKDKVVDRIWDKDASHWKSDNEHKKIIANALGWLTVPELMQKQLPQLRACAEAVKGDFDHVVVLGMGGSSLCSDVTRRLFGERPRYPKLNVLDSTVPEAVRELEQSLDLQRTFFIVASKS